MLYSSLVEKAMRFAAVAHEAQLRKGTDIPYITHLAGVALILTRDGFGDDEVLAAALLHDAVEDAGIATGEIERLFGPRVAHLVTAVSEVKRDDTGASLPWRQRKEEHLSRLGASPVEARAITLADKLHNLGTLVDDLASERTAWERFRSTPSELIWYHDAVIETAGDAPRLARLAADCREMLEKLRELVPR